MPLTREQELWTVVLQIEKAHGAEAEAFIEMRRRTFADQGDEGGAKLWREIGAKFAALKPSTKN